MVDFTLTDDQKAVRELAHDFAANAIRPVAWELDRAGTWPEDVLRPAWAVGLMTSSPRSASRSPTPAPT